MYAWLIGVLRQSAISGHLILRKCTAERRSCTLTFLKSAVIIFVLRLRVDLLYRSIVSLPRGKLRGPPDIQVMVTH